MEKSIPYRFAKEGEGKQKLGKPMAIPSSSAAGFLIITDIHLACKILILNEF